MQTALLRILGVGIATALLAGCAAPPPKPMPPPPPGDRAPSLDLTSRVQPIYPGFDVIYAIGGTTVLDTVISDTGDIVDIRIERSSGHLELDHSAIEAVRQWRFAPGNKQGHRVGGVVRIPIHFNPTSLKSGNMLWPADYAHPHYIADETPIQFETVDATLDAVASEAHSPITGTPKIKQLQIRDAQGGIIQWWIFTDLDTPDAMATRLVFRGTLDHPVVAVSSLCARAEVCSARKMLTLHGPDLASSP